MRLEYLSSSWFPKQNNIYHLCKFFVKDTHFDGFFKSKKLILIFVKSSLWNFFLEKNNRYTWWWSTWKNVVVCNRKWDIKTKVMDPNEDAPQELDVTVCER